MKKYITTLLASITIFCGVAQNKIIPNLEKKVDEEKMTQWVDSVYNTLSLDERIGQLIFPITTSSSTDSYAQKMPSFVKNQSVGGIIFIKGTPESQAAMTNNLQKLSKVPLMISIDAEWGLSMRLANTTRFPKNMMVGAIQDESLMYDYGKELARQCKVMGIHATYTPTIDINSNPKNPVIGIRSFGEDPAKVSRLAIAYSKGMEDGGVMVVAKHFPGHGDTSVDSHKALPLIQRSREQLEQVELVPFRNYVKAGFSGMLIAHLEIPALDKTGDPASLSKPIVTDLLQTDMGFSGLIITDGLAMKGVSDKPDMSVRILKAGNDIILGPISPEKEHNALKAAVASKLLSEELINERCRKVLKWKYILGVHNTPEVDSKTMMANLNTGEGDKIARKLNEKAITLVKNETNVLPIENLDSQRIAVVSLGAGKGNSFQKTLSQYASVSQFSAGSNADLNALKTSLAKFNTIVVAVHSNNSFSDGTIQDICKGKKSVLVFFTTPYKMTEYTSSIGTASGVLVGYEDTPYAREFAAQAVFGGNDVDGTLPVSVEGLFNLGFGLKLKKERLSYGIPEDVGVKSEKLNRIEKIIEEGLSQKAYPGCQVLIAKDGVVIYDKAFGTYSYGSKDSVTDESLFDIASMTKGIATVPAIMKLIDDKKINLQDKLSKYVPILKNTNKENITIREALLHETGLPSFIPYYMAAIDTSSYDGRLFSSVKSALYNAEFDNGTYARTDFKYKPELISTTPQKGYSLQIAEGLYASDSYKDTILQKIVETNVRPWKTYLYSCLNFMLLKEVVENVTKTDLNTFLQKTYFEKLGAYSTTYNPRNKFDKSQIVPTEKDDFLRRQTLQGYAHDEGAAFQGGISGNAGLFSTANDLAKVCQMLLNNGVYGSDTYLSKSTCRTFAVSTSATSRRGLGFDKPDPRISKSSPTALSAPLSTYGHTGFTGTCFWIDPDNKLIYIFLSNRVNPKRSNRKLMSLNIRSRIQEGIYNAIYDREPKAKTDKVAPAKKRKPATTTTTTTKKKKASTKSKAKKK